MGEEKSAGDGKEVNHLDNKNSKLLNFYFFFDARGNVGDVLNHNIEFTFYEQVVINLEGVPNRLESVYFIEKIWIQEFHGNANQLE